MKRLVSGLLAPALALGMLTACNHKTDDASKTAAQAPSAQASGAGKTPGGPSTTGPTGDAPGAGTKYCKLLGTDFATLFANIKGPQDAAKVVGVMRQVADEAPPEVRDDWKVLSVTFDQMQTALSKAAKLQQEARDKKLSRKQLQERSARLMQETQALNTPQNKAAGEAVARNASQYCGISLGG